MFVPVSWQQQAYRMYCWWIKKMRSLDKGCHDPFSGETSGLGNHTQLTRIRAETCVSPVSWAAFLLMKITARWVPLQVLRRTSCLTLQLRTADLLRPSTLYNGELGNAAFTQPPGGRVGNYREQSASITKPFCSRGESSLPPHGLHWFTLFGVSSGAGFVSCPQKQSRVQMTWIHSWSEALELDLSIHLSQLYDVWPQEERQADGYS